MNRMECPRCNGDGGHDAFINRGLDISTHSVEWVCCLTCLGEGTITEARAAMIEKGKALRAARVARQETLLEASRKLGIGPAELNAIEMGRAPSAAYEIFQ